MPTRFAKKCTDMLETIKSVPIDYYVWLSTVLFVIGVFNSAALWVAIALFVVGWVLQFVGHIAERKPPEFFKDWRFLFVGLRWWVAKLQGRA